MKRARIEKILIELGDDSDTLDIISKYTAAKRRKKTRDKKMNEIGKLFDLNAQNRLEFTFKGGMEILNECKILWKEFKVERNNVRLIKFFLVDDRRPITFCKKVGETWEYYTRRERHTEKNDLGVWLSFPVHIRTRLMEKEKNPKERFRNYGHMVKAQLQQTKLSLRTLDPTPDPRST